MKKPLLALACALPLALSGCAGHDHMPSKETAGMIVGALAGGLAGSQVGGGDGTMIAVGVGTLIGALVGSEIGSSLDKADRLHAEAAAQESLEDNPAGQTRTWSNPDTGNYGQITPTRTYEMASDAGAAVHCREYTQEISVVGASGDIETMTGVGTACRNPDGTWQVQQ